MLYLRSTRNGDFNKEYHINISIHQQSTQPINTLHTCVHNIECGVYYKQYMHVAATLFFLSAATQQQRCHGGGGATLKDTQEKNLVAFSSTRVYITN